MLTNTDFSLLKIGVTIHFVKRWKLVSKFLALHHQPSSHTSENLLKSLREIVSKWKLSKKVIAISADGAPSIKNVNTTLIIVLYF